MNTLEEKLAENDSKIANVNLGRDKEYQSRKDEDARNKRLFQRLQESIAEQQQSMLQYIDRADQELQKVQQVAAGPNEKKLTSEEMDEIAELVKHKKATEEPEPSVKEEVEAQENVSPAQQNQQDPLAYQRAALG